LVLPFRYCKLTNVIFYTELEHCGAHFRKKLILGSTPTGQATSRSGQFNVSSSIAAIAANNPARLGSFSCNDQAPCAASMAGLPLLHQVNMLNTYIQFPRGIHWPSYRPVHPRFSAKSRCRVILSVLGHAPRGGKKPFRGVVKG
jgi:hypothetical protein